MNMEAFTRGFKDALLQKEPLIQPTIKGYDFCLEPHEIEEDLREWAFGYVKGYQSVSRKGN